MPTDPESSDDLQASDDADARLLLEMAKHGADLSKPHRPEFALVFPSNEIARQAVNDLADKGYYARVNNEAASGDEAWVIAQRTMTLDVRGLRKVAEELERLATQHGGDYDGWGSEIVE
jgi:hypothetical protein